MKETFFKLDLEQLKEIAEDFQSKVKIGLQKDNTEIACIPTFVQPNVDGINGKALVLDLGGTNYRVAVVDFTKKPPVIHPENGWKKDLSIIKTPGFTRENLFEKMADPINEIKIEEHVPVGYCFSYPTESQFDGDAKLIRWSKGVDIPGMIGKPVGKAFIAYLNDQFDLKLDKIKVINDTVASLFAGLTYPGYDAYIGLIVGTGTNMAALMHPGKIGKLSQVTEIDTGSMISINLESGNFVPPHLTHIDDAVDDLSNKKGAQRFEKAVSGMYLGEILKACFPSDKFEEKIDAKKLTSIMNYPDMYKKKYVRLARAIYERSAVLVAASLAGLILELLSQDTTLKRIMLTAEGSLFWSKDIHGVDYKDLVRRNLYGILGEYGHADVQVDFNNLDNANLIGTAIAALS